MGGFGGGGRGMWNVPPRGAPADGIVPQGNNGGFGLFSVVDDLSLTPDGAVRDEAVAQPEVIQVEVAEGEDPAEVWDAYFRTHDPEDAAVRDAVRRLMGERQYDHIIALVKAVLRHGRPQPWMYEALNLAMQIEGHSAEEVERVVMSAVEFAQTPEDLMFIAAYLSDMGRYGRALSLYRQVARMVPLRHEPYVLGLRAAQRADDLEGQKWAALGILGQAWPKDHSHVWNAGVGTAHEIVERLEAENRTAELAEFRAALDEAVVRDVVVHVSWTGDAEIDLLVEEPAGTVCSFRSPRTPAGGILLGADLSQVDRVGSPGGSAIYVAPQGFSGDYRALVRRVWGNPTAGRVKVDVHVHYRSGREKTISRSIPLVDGEALVQFDLNDGRRAEPIEEQQLAVAAARQAEVGRHILAQQVAAAVDPRAVAHLAQTQGVAIAEGSDGSGVQVPEGTLPWVVRRGAVGYQPEITWIPEGTMAMVTAVVSADRRYVRITPSPNFSAIREVNTFNFFTGEGDVGIGGTGGAGFGGDIGGIGGGFGGGFGGGGGFF